MTSQVISAIQEKGGAGKSTMICALGSYLANTGFKVCIIDTDFRQKTTQEWADQEEIQNLDYLEISGEDQLKPTVKKLKPEYDFIFIDTAGFESKILNYTIQASDLVLIPTGGDRSTITQALKTLGHAITLTEDSLNPPKVRLALWKIKPRTEASKLVDKILTSKNIPHVSQIVPILTGFEKMSWVGGAPEGRALYALKQFIAELQIEGLINSDPKTELKEVA